MHYGYGLAARCLVAVGGTVRRTRCNSPRFNNSHWTVSPASNPMAAANAKGKLT